MPQEETFGEVSIKALDPTNDGPVLVEFDIKDPVELRISAVERLKVSKLGEHCSEAGVYLLLERPSQDGAWKVYVGKSAAEGGVKKRLQYHLSDSKKPSWYKAVAICPANSGWDEAEVTFLEGSVCRALSGLPGVSLLNTQEPGAGKLAKNRQKPLLRALKVLMDVLAALGHPAARNDNQQFHDPERSSRPRADAFEGPARTASAVAGGTSVTDAADQRLLPLVVPSRPGAVPAPPLDRWSKHVTPGLLATPGIAPRQKSAAIVALILVGGAATAKISTGHIASWLGTARANVYYWLCRAAEGGLVALSSRGPRLFVGPHPGQPAQTGWSPQLTLGAVLRAWHGAPSASQGPAVLAIAAACLGATSAREAGEMTASRVSAAYSGWRHTAAQREEIAVGADVCTGGSPEWLDLLGYWQSGR